jgi:flagellar L-ring protein FlgH
MYPLFNYTDACPDQQALPRRPRLLGFSRFFSFVCVLSFFPFLSSVSADSLWTSPSNPERSLIADIKASRIGDILTINVSESATTQASQSKKSTKESGIDSSVTSFLFPGSGLGTHKGAMPSSSLTGKSTFNGSGDVASTQSMATTAAVLVSDVLPNGNLVVEGVRVVTFAGETQYIVLHGLVRPQDITAGNTIASANIANVRVEFITEGSLNDAQKKTWLLKLYDKVRPF